VKLQKITAAAIAPYVQQAARGAWSVVESEIKQGICEAWRVNDGRAYVVTRLEPRGLVIVLGEGSGLIAMEPNFQALARSWGLRLLSGIWKHLGCGGWPSGLGTQTLSGFINWT
jgi:hypothetical protein